MAHNAMLWHTDSQVSSPDSEKHAPAHNALPTRNDGLDAEDGC